MSAPATKTFMVTRRVESCAYDTCAALHSIPESGRAASRYG
jgi:hypothetical protein